MRQIHTGKKLFPVLIACTIWAFSSPSFAEEEDGEVDELTPYFEQCLINNMENGDSLSGTMDCAQEAYKYWDAELNSAYKAAQDNCRAIGRDQDADSGKQCLNDLKQMQRAWLKDRNKLSDLVSFITPEARDSDLTNGKIDAFLSIVRVIRSQALLLKPME